jgi:hypothetical protein
MSVHISELGADAASQPSFWQMTKDSAGEVGKEIKQAVMTERVPQRAGSFITREILGDKKPVQAVYYAPPAYVNRGGTNWVLVGGAVALAAIAAAMLLGKR